MITGLKETIDAVDYTNRLMLENSIKVCDWFGRTVSEAAKIDHPYNDVTGQLTASIGYSVEQWSNGTCMVSVYALASYADEVEYGTTKSRPYPFIWPKFYQYLPEFLSRLATGVQDAFRQGESIATAMSFR